MEYIIGLILAAAVAGFATVIGLARERSFYTTVLIVVGSFSSPHRGAEASLFHPSPRSSLRYTWAADGRMRPSLHKRLDTGLQC